MRTFSEEFDVQVYDGTRPSKILDLIIKEVPLEIFLDNQKVITIACTGANIGELAAGFLRSEGLIEKLEDLDTIEVHQDKFRVNVKTREKKYKRFGDKDSTVSIMSSGARKRRPEKIKEPIISDITLPAKDALDIMEKLLISSELHRETHGAHCSALADKKGIIAFRDDIGRHNTIDMLGGYALLEKIDCSDKIVATTGRVSTEIASKVFNLGIPVIVSHSVPTTRAVTFSQDAGITLIGYVRNGKMKIYTNKKRVKF